MRWKSCPIALRPSRHRFFQAGAPEFIFEFFENRPLSQRSVRSIYIGRQIARQHGGGIPFLLQKRGWRLNLR